MTDRRTDGRKDRESLIKSCFPSHFLFFLFLFLPFSSSPIYLLHLFHQLFHPTNLIPPSFFRPPRGRDKAPVTGRPVKTSGFGPFGLVFGGARSREGHPSRHRSRLENRLQRHLHSCQTPPRMPKILQRSLPASHRKSLISLQRIEAGNVQG